MAVDPRELAKEIYHATMDLKAAEEDLEPVMRAYDQARKQRLSLPVLEERKQQCERMAAVCTVKRNQVTHLWARGGIRVAELKVMWDAR